MAKSHKTMLLHCYPGSSCHTDRKQDQYQQMARIIWIAYITVYKREMNSDAVSEKLSSVYKNYPEVRDVLRKYYPVPDPDGCFMVWRITISY